MINIWIVYMTTLITQKLIPDSWNVEKQNKNLLIWKETVGRGSNAKAFLIPEEIHLDKEAAEFIGIYLGDGKLTDGDLTHSQFHNRDFDSVKNVLKFFHFLGVKNSDITFTITHNNYDLLEAKRNFDSITKKFRIVKSDRNKFPAYSIQVNGMIFRIFLKNFIMSSLEHIKNNSELRKAFLQGYFAAEGWIGYSNKEKYLANVGFAYNPKKEIWLRDFCIECLNLEGVISKINIRHEEHGGYITIHNWENYYKMWKLGIFDGCKRKKEKFTKIFIDVKICCEVGKNMRLKLFTGDQDRLAKELGTYQATISNMKTGSKRNMWPTTKQIKKLSELHGIDLSEIKQSITRVRFGSLVTLEANEILLNDIFNRESLSS